MDLGFALVLMAGVAMVVVAAAVPLLKVIGAVVEKDLTVVEAAAIIGLLGTMAYMAIHHFVGERYGAFVLYLALMYVPWLTMSFLSHMGNVYLTRRFVTEDESKYWASLRRDPNNAAAHEFLGKLYKDRAMFDSAIHHLSEALRLMPDQPSVRWHLNDAIAERETHQRPAGAVVQCLHCRQTVAPGPFCPQCGHPMGAAGEGSPFLEFVEWIEQHGRPYIWGIGLATLVFVAIDFAFPRSPIPSALVVVCVGGGVGVLYLAWNAQRSRERK